MKKTTLKKLVDASYDKQNSLDQEKVNAIAARLKRSELKMYIKALKAHETKTTVIIETPTNQSDIANLDVKNIYPGKKIIYKFAPELIMGLRIRDNDMLYEQNIAHNLDIIMSKILQSYD